MTTFWTTADLLRLGYSPATIRAAARDGIIQPVRKGHWASRHAPGEVVRAARVGGVATGTTAARAMGLWTPPDPDPSSAFRRGDRLHVAVPRSASRLKDPDDASKALRVRSDVVVHWVDPAELTACGRTRIAPPLLALSHVFAAQPPERALAVVDAALRGRHLREQDLAALARLLPARLRPVLQHADARADSGIETIVRYLLRVRGLRVEVLPRIGSVGEVDLLVEGRLIVECDGREFHDDAQAFERDRRRDVAATRQRYRVLRLSWHQVLHCWPEAEAAVFAALAA